MNPQQQWSDIYQHGWQVKSSPMPVNWESSPTVKSIRKNKMDHRGEMGSLERASGYAMNAKPNPANTRGKKPTVLDNTAHRMLFIWLGTYPHGMSDLLSPPLPQAFGRYRPYDPVWKIWQSLLRRWYLWRVKNMILLHKKRKIYSMLLRHLCSSYQH